MTFLSASEIHQAIENGDIKFEPFEPILVKPASVVLRLDNRFRRWKRSSKPLDVWTTGAAQDYLEDIQIEERFSLGPGDFVLGSSLENISVSDELIGIMSTLSHLARLGLSAHLNSYIVSPGFGLKSPTKVAFELTSSNASPLLLRAGLPICHIAFARVSKNILPMGASSLGKSIYEGRDPLGFPLLFEEYGSILELSKHH